MYCLLPILFLHSFWNSTHLLGPFTIWIFYSFSVPLSFWTLFFIYYLTHLSDYEFSCELGLCAFKHIYWVLGCYCIFSSRIIIFIFFAKTFNLTFILLNVLSIFFSYPFSKLQWGTIDIKQQQLCMYKVYNLWAWTYACSHNIITNIKVIYIFFLCFLES